MSNSPPSYRHTILLSLVFVLLWNSGFIGAEYGLPYADPYSLVFWRYLVLTMVLAAYLLIRKRKHRFNIKKIGHASLVGLLSHGVWLSCVIISIDYGVPAGIVALVIALQPMTTGLLAGYITGEQTTKLQWFGLLTGFIGVAIALISRMDIGEAGSVDWVGYIIPFGSVLAITLASLIQRRAEINDPDIVLPVDITLFYQSLATTIVSALPAYWLEGMAVEGDIVFYASMLWLILGVSLAAYAVMWVLLSRMEATRVASLFYFGPPVTMLMGWAAFGDAIQFTDITGMVVIAIGVLMIQQPKFLRTIPRKKAKAKLAKRKSVDL